jgi:hypothetical protein
MVIGHKYGLKILVPLVITWKPSLKLWLITLVIRRMLAMNLCLKGWNQKLPRECKDMPIRCENIHSKYKWRSQRFYHI